MYVINNFTRSASNIWLIPAGLALNEARAYGIKLSHALSKPKASFKMPI